MLQIDPNRNPDESLRLNDTLQVISFATNIFTALTTEGSDQYPREMHDVLEEVKVNGYRTLLDLNIHNINILSFLYS